MRIRWVAVVAVSLFALDSSLSQEKAAPLAIHTRADMEKAVGQIQGDLDSLNQHHLRYREAAEKLSILYSDLSKKVAQVGQIANSSNSSSSNQLLNATKQMQEMQMSFNLQYLQLQEQMQNENREYTAVSNILKTRHDTVKNSIANIR